MRERDDVVGFQRSGQKSEVAGQVGIEPMSRHLALALHPERSKCAQTGR